MRNYIITSLYFLVLIYPWGRFFDKVIFSTGQTGSRGISSLVIFIIILLGLLNKNLLKGFNKIPKKIFLLVFLSFTFFATTLSNSPEKIFSDFVNLLVYFLLMFVIVGINPSFREIIKLVKLLFFSTLLMASLSLLDFFNYIDLPYFNEAISNIKVGDSFIFDLTGPFLIRTEIGYHISLMIVLPLLFLFQEKRSFSRIISYSFSFFILIMTAYFCNTRSIFFSLIFCVMYLFIIVTKKLKGLKYLAGFLFFIILGYSVSNSFINESNLFLRTLGTDSDMTRFYALKATFFDIIENPIGAGLDRPFIEEIGSYKDVHSSITYLLRAGGFVGFLSLMYFFLPIVKKIFRFQVSLRELIVFLPVISLLCFGFFHTSIQVSTFWVLMGIIFSINFNKKTT